MSLVENLQVWKEAVQYYNEGDFQGALKKFKDMNDSSAKIMFNIGRVYLSLCELQKAFQVGCLIYRLIIQFRTYSIILSGLVLENHVG